MCLTASFLSNCWPSVAALCWVIGPGQCFWLIGVRRRRQFGSRLPLVPSRPLFHVQSSEAKNSHLVDIRILLKELWRGSRPSMSALSLKYRWPGGKTSPLCSCEQVSQKLLRCRIGLPIHRRRKGRCRGGSVDQQRRQQQLRHYQRTRSVHHAPAERIQGFLFYFFLMLKHQTSTINRITTCRSSKVSNLRKYLRGETKSWSSKTLFFVAFNRKQMGIKDSKTEKNDMGTTKPRTRFKVKWVSQSCLT